MINDTRGDDINNLPSDSWHLHKPGEDSEPNKYCNGNLLSVFSQRGYVSNIHSSTPVLNSDHESNTEQGETVGNIDPHIRHDARWGYLLF